MPNSNGQTLGYTASVSSASMQQTTVITSRDAGGPIRSVTIGNQTTSTTAVLYLSAVAQGQAVFAVIPGQWATIPVQECSGIAIKFAAQAGQSFDGAIYIHADTEPLAASGFQAATTAPLWVWDQSNWDGGGVWST